MTIMGWGPGPVRNPSVAAPPPAPPRQQLDQPNPRGRAFPIEDRTWLQATDIQQSAVLNPNGAQFLGTSITSVSSLDTGRLGYVLGWGGNEFGYAYTYALDGTQPAGLTIDADMGILTAASPIAAGSYTFGVIVTNRETPANGNTLSFTLPVVQGVTSGRTGTQVLHKTYDPHSGTWGTPTGSDWTTVLLNIQTAILADQATNLDAAGVETQLRATIPFHKATTYNYSNNHWLTGVQYYDITATGSGARPILQNNGSGTVYEGGPLNIGNSGSMNRGGSRKINAALINTVAAGSFTVTLQTPAQVSRLVVGRWHQVVGQMIQIAGEPPNCMFVEYVRVLAVNASTGLVTFDRPLRFAYDQTWYEVNDDISFGRGWICPADTDSNGRATLRGRFFGINFQPNPNGSNIMLLQSHIQSDFDNCIVQNYQVTMGKHYAVLNGSAIASSSEPDKLSETLFIDASTTVDVGGATGFQYLLARNTTFNNPGAPDTVQISPRQFRSLGCTIDAINDTTPPFTFAFNGPNWYLDFKNTVFHCNVGNVWTYTGNPFAPLTIGTDATWNGNQLRIPNSFGSFENWLINSYAGGIVAVSGLGPVTTNWGYISSVTSDQAGGALWLNIVWVNGSKPLSGTIDIVAARFRRLFMEPTCSFTGSLSYNDARMTKQTTTPFEANWDFPAGYPAQYAK